MAPTGYKIFPLAALATLALSGCSTLPPSAKQYHSFTEYAESVFRHQNDLISRLMMLNEAEQLPDSEVLDCAEERMHDACHLLNEYAERESEGDSMGLLFKRRVQNSIEDCDRSIQNLEQLLSSFSKH